MEWTLLLPLPWILNVGKTVIIKLALFSVFIFNSRNGHDTQILITLSLHYALFLQTQRIYSCSCLSPNDPYNMAISGICGRSVCPGKTYTQNSAQCPVNPFLSTSLHWNPTVQIHNQKSSGREACGTVEGAWALVSVRPVISVAIQKCSERISSLPVIWMCKSWHGPGQASFSQLKQEEK